jgi:hypothetical protein
MPLSADEEYLVCCVDGGQCQPGEACCQRKGAAPCNASTPYSCEAEAKNCA